MPQTDVLTLVANGGSTLILLVVLWFLWQEYKVQTSWMREQFAQSAAERKVLAQALGITTAQLATKASALRVEGDGG